MTRMACQEPEVITEVGDEQHQIEDDDEKRERQRDGQHGTEDIRGDEPGDHRHEHEPRGEVVEEEVPYDDVLPVGKMNYIVLLIGRWLAFDPCSIHVCLPSYSKQTIIAIVAIKSVPMALA